ncbi:MAG: sodium:solute symporter, partial [Alloprevotella sp.]|nr:sodium:solute symporter [Alloprevotella sp.]
MTALFMLATLVAYFSLLLCISRRAARGGRGGNDAFFRAGRQSPWWMVAFGMVGASISGVTFISVPGWAASTGMTYLQMCMGFVVGYVAVAFVLLPLYYRLRLTSIYAYLGERFGPRTHRTGALFFVLSKLMGAAARMYLVCMVLAQFVIVPYLGSGLLPFLLVVAAVLLLIWLYTRQAGMQAIVRTDALQTLCLLLAAGGMAVAASQTLGLDLRGAVQTVCESPMCRVWEWDGASKQAFWRQFLSGVFIVVVMTGLDQDMMQKNL